MFVWNWNVGTKGNHAPNDPAEQAVLRFLQEQPSAVGLVQELKNTKPQNTTPTTPLALTDVTALLKKLEQAGSARSTRASQWEAGTSYLSKKKNVMNHTQEGIHKLEAIVLSHSEHWASPVDGEMTNKVTQACHKAEGLNKETAETEESWEKLTTEEGRLAVRVLESQIHERPAVAIFASYHGRASSAGRATQLEDLRLVLRYLFCVAKELKLPLILGGDFNLDISSTEGRGIVKEAITKAIEKVGADEVLEAKVRRYGSTNNHFAQSHSFSKFMRRSMVSMLERRQSTVARI